MCTMEAIDFFLNPSSVPQKQYEALRAYYVENRSAKEVAEDFGYKHRGFTSIVLNFNKKPITAKFGNLIEIQFITNN